MSRRGAGLKLAMLAVPLAAGVVSLHAFGEPGGRAARKALMTLAYPEHDHGAFRVRIRRGGAYHVFVAQALEEFTREAAGAWGLRPPGRVTVLLLDSMEDLEAFGFETGRPDPALDSTVADPATATIALIGDVATRHQDQDARALRHLMAHLLFPRAAPPWLAEGLACHYEAGSRVARGEPPPLALLLQAREADFRGPAGAGLLEAARLFTAFLVEKNRETVAALLRGESAPLLDDLPALEEKWRAWLPRAK